MKKLLAIVLVMAMLFSFAACSKQNDNKEEKEEEKEKQVGNFAVPEEGYDGSVVTIRFYYEYYTALSDEMDKYIKEFNKLYPKIIVEDEYFGNKEALFDYMATMMTVGETPHITCGSPNQLAYYQKEDTLVTLDDLISSQIPVTRADGSTEVLGLTQAQIDDFIPGVYAGGRSPVDGCMYSLPYRTDYDVLYYNKTFFDENKIPVPATWEEMEQVCRRIKELDPDSVPLGYYSENNLLINYCYQTGSDYLSADGDVAFNNAQNRDFLRKLRQWREEGLLLAEADFYSDFTVIQYLPSGYFVKEVEPLCYMVIDSVSAAERYAPSSYHGAAEEFEVGVAMLPQENPSDPKVICTGSNMCIFQKENPQEVIASWLFVKFLATKPEFQLELAMMSNMCPVTKTAAQLPEYQNYLASADGGDNLPALAASTYAAQWDALYKPAGTYWERADSIVQWLVLQCLIEETDGDEEAAIQEWFDLAVEGIHKNETNRPR